MMLLDDALRLDRAEVDVEMGRVRTLLGFSAKSDFFDNLLSPTLVRALVGEAFSAVFLGVVTVFSLLRAESSSSWPEF